MLNEELIEKAANIIEPKNIGDFLIGDVGCALETEDGNIYLGICADIASNSFCAELNAIGSMITDKRFIIKKIVAVWRDDQNIVRVIPPCGNCRELMRQIDPKNMDAEVILDNNRVLTLKELLPYTQWE